MLVQRRGEPGNGAVVVGGEVVKAWPRGDERLRHDVIFAVPRRNVRYPTVERDGSAVFTGRETFAAVSAPACGGAGPMSRATLPRTLSLRIMNASGT
jgi:hypothetical protein